MKMAQQYAAHTQSKLNDWYTPSAVEAFSAVEAEFQKKVGPMGAYLPFSDDGMSKLRRVMSDSPVLSRLNLKALELTGRWFESLIPRGSIHHADLNEVIYGMKDSSDSHGMDPTRNSGWPYCRSKWLWSPNQPGAYTPSGRERELAFKAMVATADATIRQAHQVSSYKEMPLHLVGLVHQRVNEPKGPNPFHWSDEKGEFDVKRIVIAMPKDLDGLPGGTVNRSLVAKFRNIVNPATGLPIAMGWNSQPVIDADMERLLRQASARNLTVLSGDVSNFDGSLPPWLIMLVARHASVWMDKPTANLFLAGIDAFVYKTSVIYPGGVIDEGPSKVKSGSQYTNTIDTLCNTFIQKYGEFAGYYTLISQHSQGDDFLLLGPGVNPNSVERCFGDFGMVCNAAKQFYEPHMLNFLRKLYIEGVPGGIASFNRVVGRSLSLEDDTILESEEINPYSVTVQLEARLNTMAFNPLFEDAVHFFQEHDKFKLFKDISPEALLKRAGDYGERVLWTATRVKQQARGDMPFASWPVNRVIRGEKLPPPGEGRFLAVHGKRLSAVPTIG
jgi:hypothetical protein